MSSTTGKAAGGLMVVALDDKAAAFFAKGAVWDVPRQPLVRFDIDDRR